MALVCFGVDRENSSSSHQSQTTDVSSSRAQTRSVLTDLRRQRVCHELKQYPLKASDGKSDDIKLSFEMGLISPLCSSFVRGQRSDLDRCGDPKSDRFKQVEPQDATAWLDTFKNRSPEKTQSSFTWPSHDEMLKTGQVNLFTDPVLANELPKLYSRIEEIRTQATQMCCGDDNACKDGLAAVEVVVCKPPADGSISDPCVHGGAYEMAGSNYTSIFSSLSQRYNRDEDRELYRVAARNLPVRLRSVASLGSQETLKPFGGKIVLTSYVKKQTGIKSLEPTLYHEFGHACTMVKMQVHAERGDQPEIRSRALNAIKWFDRVKHRCSATDDPGMAAYQDFWESVGESKELAACFARITELNRNEQIDRKCEGLCPGHYMEETVGVAFSMLNGDLSGAPGAVFPQTCDHMRDRQHPMVADVVECLAQHSPKFRKRLGAAYNCG